MYKNENLFKDFLHLKRGKNSKVRLFMDIETFTYNKKMGWRNPSLYKSDEFSVAISFFLNDEENIPNVIIFPSFFSFLSFMFENAYKKYEYVLVFHNGYKFDNHFFRNSVIRNFENVKLENMYLRNAVSNRNTVTKKNILNDDNDIIIAEKRVKSSSTLDIFAYIKGFKFSFEDTYIKTNTSIRVLGKKLLNNGYISEKYLKTDFDYLKYDVEDDLTYEGVKKYQLEIYKNLSNDELTYIENDVIILALVYKYFSEILFGFDYEKITYTQNIKEKYTNNPISNFQLLNIYNDNKKINYTDYTFSNRNLYNYIKNFYKGGLNFYNDAYVGKIIREKSFSIDENSAYPYVMYSEKVPMFIDDFREGLKPFTIEIDYKDKNYFYLLEIPIEYMQKIITLIQSKILKQMIVKYYSSKDSRVFVPSSLFLLLESIENITINEISVYSFIKWECHYFASRDIIDEFYYIKTQGKQKYRLDYKNPLDIKLTNIKNDIVFDSEEIAGSKVHLNGLYGIPALRSHFNLFRYNENGEIVNIENGFKNTERNLIFSVFVTAYSLYNLLYPLKFLSSEQIDDYFLYCDTDSLYLKKEAFHLIPPNLYNPFILGAWDIENKSIEKFYILNHKKYCYLVNDKIKVKSGGIVLSQFNTNMSFEKFVETQFSNDTVINNTHSILNDYGTITIYSNETKLQLGQRYFSNYDNNRENDFEILKNLVKEELYQSDSKQMLYAETPLGSISFSDFTPEFEKTDFDIDVLKIGHDLIRQKYKSML